MVLKTVVGWREKNLAMHFIYDGKPDAVLVELQPEQIAEFLSQVLSTLGFGMAAAIFSGTFTLLEGSARELIKPGP